MKKLIIIAVSLLVATTAFGQKKDYYVVLNNGTYIQGKLISEDEESVTFNVRKGGIQVFDKKNVKEVVKWKDAPSQAYKNAIGFNVNSLINSTFSLSYERPLAKVHKKLSVGGIFDFCPSVFAGGTMTGFDVTPFARWYFRGEGNNYGFYGQIKLNAGYHKIDMNKYADAFDDLGTGIDSWEPDKSSYVLENESFASFGAGFGIGWLMKFKRTPHWAIDFHAGFLFRGGDIKISKYDEYGEIVETTSISKYDVDSMGFRANFITHKGPLGVGSPLDLKLGLFYRF